MAIGDVGEWIWGFIWGFIGWMLIIGFICVMTGIVGYIVVMAHEDITFTYHLEEECEQHPNICFCDNMGCTVKTSCTTTSSNPDCDYTEICDFARELKWKRILWDYDCEGEGGTDGR